MDKMETVYLQRCARYADGELLQVINNISVPLGLDASLKGRRVLIKPNLIKVEGRGLACTHPQVILTLCSWCLDHGAEVVLGDSPAFGTSYRALRKIGILNTLKNMGVKVSDFGKRSNVTLPGGVKVRIATDALECDLFVNLPKIKAHAQMYVTVGMKNIFGIVSGLKKPLLHMQYGECENRFAEIIVDLLAVLPANITLVDGIEVMHKTGPIHGDALMLGCFGAANNPVAMDRAVMEMLQLDGNKNPLYREAARRKMTGTERKVLNFPLLQPEEFYGSGFQPPEELLPVRFNSIRFLKGQAKRLALRYVS